MTHTHRFKRGGKCEGCDEWCPHPMFGPKGTCLDCGCLQPMYGSPDFYEIPLPGWGVCSLGMPAPLPDHNIIEGDLG